MILPKCYYLNIPIRTIFILSCLQQYYIICRPRQTTNTTTVNQLLCCTFDTFALHWNSAMVPPPKLYELLLRLSNCPRKTNSIYPLRIIMPYLGYPHRSHTIGWKFVKCAHEFTLRSAVEVIPSIVSNADKL